MKQKTWKMTETQAHGYSSESIQSEFPMNTNMTGSTWLSNIFTSLCFGQIASALEGLIGLEWNVCGLLQWYAVAFAIISKFCYSWKISSKLSCYFWPLYKHEWVNRTRMKRLWIIATVCSRFRIYLQILLIPWKLLPKYSGSFWLL